MEILKVQNLTKEYGPLTAVNDVNFSIEEGQVLGLIGPNGAGKTTLLRILATLLRPTCGTAKVLGSDLLYDYLEIRKDIGFLPDFFNLYKDLTVSECLEFFAKAYDVIPDSIPGRIQNVLEQVGLIEKKDDYIQHLSRGMLQRIGVAALMVRSPRIYILDEPASGLDPRARIQLREALKKLAQQGKTIIISSHILTELSGFCTHIAIMDKGQIVVHGSVDDIQREISDSRKFKIGVLNDPQRAVDIINSWDRIDVIDVNDTEITIKTVRDLNEVADLNAHLIHSGLKVIKFYEEKTNIEDVFMKISSPS